MPLPPVLIDLDSVELRSSDSLPPLNPQVKRAFSALESGCLWQPQRKSSHGENSHGENSHGENSHGENSSDPLLLKSNQKSLCNKPLRVAILLSGGPAPGGHNVIAGLYDALMEIHPDSALIGFLDGCLGLLEDRSLTISSEILLNYRQTGGFDLLGSSRTRVHEPEQLAACRAVVTGQRLDGLVIVGGDDSNTNAAILAQDFAAHGLSCVVVGVPKTIDGDLKNGWIEQSFGHDTACRVYSDLISSIARDCLSSKKYYHFIRLMGRSASHIALECALQTHPTWVLIAEELGQNSELSLQDIARSLAQVILDRRKRGLDHGIILIPEGLLEFLPQTRELFAQIEQLQESRLHESRLHEPRLHESRLHESRLDESQSKVATTPEQLIELLGSRAEVYRQLPREIQQQLLLERDPHGHLQISRIETEKILIQLVEREVAHSGEKLSAMAHFFGYEARAAMPSDFDATYTYALGRLSSLLIKQRITGFMAVIQNLAYPAQEWKPLAVPLVQMLAIEGEPPRERAVIARSQVDLNSPSFQYLLAHRDEWAERDRFRFAGPMQFFGPMSVRSQGPLALRLDHNLSIEGIV